MICSVAGKSSSSITCQWMPHSVESLALDDYAPLAETTATLGPVHRKHCNLNGLDC